MEENLSLEWLLSHPYVQVWRNQSNNSLVTTAKTLNNTLNVSSPITIGRVERIVTAYLNRLVQRARALKYHASGKIRDEWKKLGEMCLTDLEVTFLRSKLVK